MYIIAKLNAVFDVDGMWLIARECGDDERQWIHST